MSDNPTLRFQGRQYVPRTLLDAAFDLAKTAAKPEHRETVQIGVRVSGVILDKAEPVDVDIPKPIGSKDWQDGYTAGFEAGIQYHTIQEQA